MVDHGPAVRGHLDGAPGGVPDVDHDPLAVTGDAVMNLPLLAAELSPRLESGDRLIYNLARDRLLRVFVVDPPEPELELRGADAPGLAVSIDLDGRVRDPGWGVEEVMPRLLGQQDEPGGGPASPRGVVRE